MIYKISNGKELEYEIIRKNNKNVYFRIKEDLKLYVTAPMYLSGKSIEKLIAKNEEAILKMYEKQEDKRKDINKYIYLGKKYYVEIDINAGGVTFKDDVVYTPSLETLNWFTKCEIERIFGEEIELGKKCFSKLPNFTWKVRKMKTRWGVCNTKKKEITLNTLLIEKEVDLIDYVVIHELCHFFEGNHSRAFWNLVGQAYPKYKEARKRLKE